MFPSNFVEVIEEESGNGLFTSTDVDTGSDPFWEGFHPDLSVATVVPKEILILHTKGNESQSLSLFGIGTRRQTANRVRLRVCEEAIKMDFE